MDERKTSEPECKRKDELESARTGVPESTKTGELESARKEINRIDAEMAKLFEARMAVSANIGAYKQRNGLPVRDPVREQELLEKNAGLIRNEDVLPYYTEFLIELMSLSRSYQERRNGNTQLNPDAQSERYDRMNHNGQLKQNGQTNPDMLPDHGVLPNPDVLPDPGVLPDHGASPNMNEPPNEKELAYSAIPVRLGERSYEIILARGALREAGRLLRLDRRVLLVTDSGVPERYVSCVAEQCGTVRIECIPQGEASKSPEMLRRLLSSMLDMGLTRSDCVVAVGGGVVGDLAGFAASCYMRGIDFYNIPTTLLAQVDSSVGGKTAIDFNGVKNVIGVFYQPARVLIDPETLETLSPRLLREGLAEIIKMSLTGDPALFELLEKRVGVEKDVMTAKDNPPEKGTLLWKNSLSGEDTPQEKGTLSGQNSSLEKGTLLWQGSLSGEDTPQSKDTPQTKNLTPFPAADPFIEQIIERAIRIKTAVVEQDETEQGYRRILNFGHTVGHAIESLRGGRLLHGECVALGMLPMCSPELRERLIQMLECYGLPTVFEPDMTPEALLPYILHDKKKQGDRISCVLAEAPGKAVIQPLTPEEIRERICKVK